MSLTLKTFTLNCGNDTPGRLAVEQLAKEMSDVDLIVLHCQEVNFDKTYQQLRQAFPAPLEIEFAEKMVTHTKLDTQFHSQTGMATIIVRKPQVEIVHSETQLARRGEGRMDKGYNKGGTHTALKLRKDDQEFYLSLSNAHLDAFNEAARAKDWINLHKTRKFHADTWDELSRKTPDMVANGYDANTRNYLLESDGVLGSTNPWQYNAEPGMQELVMAPLGNQQQSRTSTYKNNLKDMPLTADKKRPGFAKGGMLDIVSVNDAGLAKQQIHQRSTSQGIQLVLKAAVKIAPEKNSGRDHSVIGSHPVAVQKQSPFLKVRDYLACSLIYAAPEITAHILDDDFTDTSENRRYLLKLHEYYLSPQGMMQTQLQLHHEKLELWNKLKSSPNADKLKQGLFKNNPTWFEYNSTFPEGRAGLDKVAIVHTHQQALESLQIQYLRKACSEEERLDILSIVDNAALELKQTEKPAVLLKTAETLLKFSHLTHQYKSHLLKDCVNENEHSEKNPPLLKNKLDAVNRLREITLHKPEPATLGNLGRELNKSTTLLKEHRHQGIFNSLFRKLKELISHYIPKTAGQLFAEKAKNVLSREKVEPGTVDTEKRNTSMP
ncbi:hypothetical protein Lqui_2966 [Legionella quinlivanii]|uniref:Uncharacterized protein n=1 Tax=Legionella quinlivanii TaxID=45073 RepID=A0A0W0XLN8_9GAMM|nr:hypothetical protein [Legionella quinlivanii]KTD45495.1 hypothetical protein Lqui_2966 [Legionella quinlivanii]SEG45719.1 hypothetical protein SAMN02746093_03015 [Legionella quinlivanii DSM 21216]STY11560.1 Uncharacterised protein [Legionella quinlivanii]